MYRNMGTTLVGMLCYEDEYYWFNCGDSRLYRLHGDQFEQLTTDHSLSQAMGLSTHSSQITNCIGGGTTECFIDMERITDFVQPGDIFMLCSDGLTDMINDDEIKRLLSMGFDADALCEAAEDAGGYDNVSVVVIKVE
jgi:protein phosphatase